jgi:hypothetical protein
MCRFLLRGKGLVAMMLAAYSAASFWQFLNGFNGESNTTENWWRYSGIAAFVGFCLIVMWGWYGDWKRAEEIEENHPTVTALPNHNRKQFWLLVTNTGRNAADFGANITFSEITLASDDKAMVFNAKWQGNSPNEVFKTLTRNQTCRLDIGQTEGIDLDNNEGVTVYTAGGIKQGRVPFKGTMTCEIEVYSKPALKKDFKQRYLLHIDPDTHQCGAFEERA